MIGRDADEGRAQQRVGAGGIDLDPVVAGQVVDEAEGELQTARLADPVRLHQLDLRRPVVEAVETLEQLFGIVGDAEEPLGQLAPLDLCAGAPALAVLHLFVGKNGHVDRVPVHHGLLAVDQALFEEVEEQRLLLAIIFGIAGRQFARPVDRQAQRLHLIAHVGDVLVGPVTRVAAAGHGRVFGRHAEGVPAHRVQNVVARRHLVARDHVAHRVVAHMADVDAPRRIGKHFKDIVFRLVVRTHRLEDIRLRPCGLPAGFDLGRGVAGHRWDAFIGQGMGARRMAIRSRCRFGRICSEAHKPSQG